MSSVIKMEIVGLDEVLQALDELPANLTANVLRSINRAAVKKFIVDNLRETLTYSVRSVRGIGITGDRKNKTAVFGGVTTKAFWLRFADKGTIVRTVRTGVYKGANRGSITGRRQIEPAILGQVDNIIEFVNTELGNEIKKQLEKRLRSTTKKLSRL